MEPFAARQRPAVLRLGMGQAPHAVLDNHHRAVHDDPEVQCAQAHQVRADLLVHHAGEREEHRERDDQRGDQRSAQVPEEQEKHDDDQHGAFEQVLLDGVDRLVDKHRPVVDGDRLHAFGQRAIDLLHLLGDRLGDDPAVFPDQHENRAEHHLTAVVGRGSRAQFFADLHLGNVAHAHGRASAARQDDVAKVFDAPCLARRTDQVLLPASLDIACTDVRVVALERLDDVGHGETIGRQLLGVRRDLVLLLIAAD